MNKILEEFGEIDVKLMKIINIGLIFSFGVGMIGLILLLTYNTYFVTYDFFEAGFILIRTSFAFAAQLIGCGFLSDKLIKNKI